MGMQKNSFIIILVIIFLLGGSSCFSDIIVSINKKAYRQGEKVSIIIVNSLNEEASILWHPFTIEKFKNGRWEEIKIVWCPCGSACKVPNAVRVPNLGSKEYSWDQMRSECLKSGEKKTQVDAGTYRVNVRLYPDGEKITSEFSILGSSKVLKSGY